VGEKTNAYKISVRKRGGDKPLEVLGVDERELLK
jgi:hypothetical protein